MKKIIKYKLDYKKQLEFELLFNKGSKFLAIKEQKGIPSIWALEEDTVTDQIESIRIRINFVPTGWSIPSKLEDKYLDTLVLEGGNLILHAFGEQL